MLKFAVFLALALYSVQALPSDSLEYTALDADILRTRNVIDELQKFVEEGIEIFKKIASDISEKYEEAIDKLIGDILHGSEIVKKCIEKYENEIKELRKNTHEGIRKCVDQAKEELEPLKEELGKVHKELEDEVHLIKTEIKECNGEHPSLITIIKCTIKEHAKEKENLHKILKHAHEIIKANKEIVAEIKARLISCNKKVIGKSIKDGKVIVEKIKECIHNASNESY